MNNLPYAVDGFVADNDITFEKPPKNSRWGGEGATDRNALELGTDIGDDNQN